MRFLRSVKGYTRLDKIESEVLRTELEISGIQDVRAKYKQNRINHLERMDNTRLPKHDLNYKTRGRRDRGRPRKRWQRVDAGRIQAT
jgi:predicted ArsR family transcriptional regulator